MLIATVIHPQFLEEALKSGCDWGLYYPLLQEDKGREWIQMTFWAAMLKSLIFFWSIQPHSGVIRTNPFFKAPLGFVFKDSPPAETPYLDPTPLGFINNQKTESVRDKSELRTYYYKQWTHSCLLAFFFWGGDVNQRTRKQLFSQSRCVNDTPKALHIQES